MYESFYGFKLKPFQIIPDPDFLYLSPNHSHALQYLEYGIEHNIGIILLSGEVGSGKTTLIRYLRQQIGQDIHIVILSNTNLTANQLLECILIELDIEPDGTKKAQNLMLFKTYLNSLKAEMRRLILIVDESQNLPRDTLEEIRMLSNFQADDGLPLQIFLVGQPELRTILKSPGMSQIRQRIAVNYHLNALSLEETMHYIQYRLKIAGASQNPFTVDAVRLIFQSSSGIPRAINILCDSALLYGFAEESQTIEENIVKNVISELDLHYFVQEGKSTEEPDLAPSDSSKYRKEVVFSENPKSEDPKKETEANTLIKKSYGIVKQRLERIEVKLDILREEITKIRSDSVIAENRHSQYLSTEIEKIRSDLEILRQTAQQHGPMPDENKDESSNTDADTSGKSENKDIQGKIYKLDK